MYQFGILQISKWSFQALVQSMEGECTFGKDNKYTISVFIGDGWHTFRTQICCCKMNVQGNNSLELSTICKTLIKVAILLLHWWMVVKREKIFFWAYSWILRKKESLFPRLLKLLDHLLQNGKLPRNCQALTSWTCLRLLNHKRMAHNLQAHQNLQDFIWTCKNSSELTNTHQNLKMYGSAGDSERKTEIVSHTDKGNYDTACFDMLYIALSSFQVFEMPDSSWVERFWCYIAILPVMKYWSKLKPLALIHLWDMQIELQICKIR